MAVLRCSRTRLATNGTSSNPADRSPPSVNFRRFDMSKRRLGRSELFIEPLVLGGNVFGWTLEEAPAFKVLDAFVDAGFTAVDTSDSYGKGKSETIIGNWLKARGNRNK